MVCVRVKVRRPDERGWLQKKGDENLTKQFLLLAPLALLLVLELTDLLQAALPLLLLADQPLLLLDRQHGSRSYITTTQPLLITSL